MEIMIFTTLLSLGFRNTLAMARAMAASTRLRAVALAAR
jgi:hypothetical protein